MEKTNPNNMEKTFEELMKPCQKRLDWHNQNRIYIDKADVLQLLQQVREATIAEAVNHCVSQDWVKTIDNLKKMPIDRIYNFEKLPTEQL